MRKKYKINNFKNNHKFLFQKPPLYERLKILFFSDAPHQGGNAFGPTVITRERHRKYTGKHIEKHEKE